jgi:hypothetical protein
MGRKSHTWAPLSLTNERGAIVKRVSARVSEIIRSLIKEVNDVYGHVFQKQTNKKKFVKILEILFS